MADADVDVGTELASEATPQELHSERENHNRQSKRVRAANSEHLNHDDSIVMINQQVQGDASWN
jgi:hypothetical protein